MINEKFYSVKERATDSDLKDIIQIGSTVYNREFAGTYDIVKTWLNKNDEIYTVLMYGSKVVGYVNLIPLNKATYTRIKSGEITDMDITACNVVKYAKGKALNVVLVSMYIEEEHKSDFTFTFLLDAVKAKVNKYNISEIVMVAENKEIETLATTYKNCIVSAFDKNNNKVYEVSV